MVDERTARLRLRLRVRISGLTLEGREEWMNGFDGRRGHEEAYG
jgi:hypothetical protein